MKGLELPISMIVVIAVAVLVLVVIAVFFTGQTALQTETIKVQNALSTGCQKLRTLYNCVGDLDFTVGYIEPGRTEEATFKRICELNKYSVVECKKYCGCPA
ncbi:MAG: hypothetical protein QXD48_01100 [Candidatus Aenigmatarchaeota archaeon]